MSPSRSQFFLYERFSLSCDALSQGGLLKRNTTRKGVETCPNGWGALKNSTCTIYTTYPFDDGLYRCETESGEQSLALTISVTAALRVLPNRSQFFKYESLSLSCGEQAISSHWTVKRNTSYRTNEECTESWLTDHEENKKPARVVNEPDYFLDCLFPFDSGVYWCESAAGECSQPVNITVTHGVVILESPALPVKEGDSVTLRCTSRLTSSTVQTDFYKDGRLISSSKTGNMTIHSVSRSDEGLYKCISGVEESLDSWMSVRVAGTPYLLSTIILALIYRDRRRAARVVSEERSHRVIMEME
ncbi:uncharacterized protein LOC121505019 isoform X2 [Cheilinus undulatus]|uniref:uncharacterized protein LOC121505019 isoform X2 n=1 Tax=Cheilinus undulatus TaxID=241271 RepID=UPI001BD1CD90|nr:uncharacterized protein LOC121505019 isoform X2 [Cheilinus undulatus]